MLTVAGSTLRRFANLPVVKNSGFRPFADSIEPFSPFVRLFLTLLINYIKSRLTFILAPSIRFRLINFIPNGDHTQKGERNLLLVNDLYNKLPCNWRSKVSDSIKGRNVKVGLYSRVSTQDQSVEMQVSDLRRYCEQRGFEIYREYTDEGVSGTKTEGLPG